jgi:hypothetical protein
MSKPPEPESSEQAELQRIVAELGAIGYCLPGSVTSRSLTCGRAGCACKANPPRLHGPYCQWSRKIEGKTVSRWLSVEQLERYEPWFANARRARELLTELEALSLRIAERAEGFEPQVPPTGHRRRGERTKQQDEPPAR